MAKQVSVSDDTRTDNPGAAELNELASDLAYQRLALVNVAYVGHPENGRGQWVLIDAGVVGTTGLIMEAVESRFGADARPAAIVMTHGHFDHVGALPDLAERWDVPIYAHELEMPYLNGEASYPPPDPSVGGGIMSALSRFYPRGPVDVGRWLRSLPSDGSVPEMPSWKWLHTPGHTPGHISLWRESDKTLIAGDAFITTAQESAYAVAAQRPELHGPPMYYTQNWDDAELSVHRLAELEPETVITGHGPALRGAEMRTALHTLANDFRRVAVPEGTHYAAEPASVERGNAYRAPGNR